MAEEPVAEEPVEPGAEEPVAMEAVPENPAELTALAAQSADPRVRALRKKLAQISKLEEWVEEGWELTEEQTEKLERKAELEEELAEILEPEAPAEAEEVVEPKTGKKSKKKKKGGASAEGAAVEENAPLSLKLPLSVSVDDDEVTCKRSISNTIGSPKRSPWMAPLCSPSLLCRSPSSRWQEDPVSVEDIAPTPMAPKEPPVEFIENIQPFSPATQSHPRLKSIMQEVTLLSNDAFEEDALHMVTRKGGWRMTLMVCPEGSVDAETLPLNGFCLDAAEPQTLPSLIGFLVYRLRPELDCLSIAKIAIVPEHRRLGHGKRLIDWCIKSGKKQKSLDFISLSSLPEAVKFYQHIGFRAIDVKLEGLSNQCGPDEDLVEGQVYMEYRLNKRGRKKKR